MLDYRSPQITAVSQDYYSKSLKHPLGISSQIVVHEADRASSALKKQFITEYLGADESMFAALGTNGTLIRPLEH
jgi:hypothetical protein